MNQIKKIETMLLEKKALEKALMLLICKNEEEICNEIDLAYFELKELLKDTDFSISSHVNGLESLASVNIFIFNDDYTYKYLINIVNHSILDITGERTNEFNNVIKIVEEFLIKLNED